MGAGDFLKIKKFFRDSSTITYHHVSKYSVADEKKFVVKYDMPRFQAPGAKGTGVPGSKALGVHDLLGD